MKGGVLLFLLRYKVEEVGEALSPASLLYYMIFVRVTEINKI